MEENKRLKDYDVYDLIRELRSRGEVIDVTVWLKDDIESALKDHGYVPTEERITEVDNVIRMYDLVNWDHAWECFYQAINDCDFGEPDLEE